MSLPKEHTDGQCSQVQPFRKKVNTDTRARPELTSHWDWWRKSSKVSEEGETESWPSWKGKEAVHSMR